MGAPKRAHAEKIEVMNEEEARAKLKARLDGWQAYLGAEKPSVPETTSRALAVITDAAPTGNGDATNTQSASGTEDEFTEAARIAALKATLTQERERSRPQAETMTREQRIHAVTLAGMPPYTSSGIGLGGKDDYASAPMDREQRKSAVFLTISFLTLMGFCVIFLYVLFGK